MVFNLSSQNSIALQFLNELRDKQVQQDRQRFRKNMQRLGQLMAYEISKVLSFRETSIETPLATVLSKEVQPPVLLTVMRAGLPYFQGFLDFYDNAECGFIGAYRKEGEQEITINLEYVAAPSLTNKHVFIIDPMLATGKSFIRTIEALSNYGTPLHVHLVSVVAAPEGITFVEKNMKQPYSIWTCAIDQHLNDECYIVPGLGDAGDLSYGEKH